MLWELSATELGGDGVVPSGDRGSHSRVGDAVRRQVGKFEEHLFQAAGNHEGEKPAAFGTCDDLVPGAARHEDVGSWACRDLLLADGEVELAVEHVEGLLHFAVDVRHSPQALAAGELGESKGTVGRGLPAR